MMGWVAFAAGCAPDFRECAPVGAADLAMVPELLSETGLYSDVAADLTAEGVMPFSPSFALWSDGAEKRRWIRLPPGTVIDTSDMDDWQFPEGTKLWKEFTRDGVRIETRLLQKIGPAAEDWVAIPYVWSADQTGAVRVLEGLEDANGTLHDVPSAADCMGCHGGTRSRVLGFSAIQLSHEGADGEVDLQDLIDAGLLSAPPAAGFEVPGNETERAALGYMHANCGHCHNQDRPPTDGPRCYDPDNTLDFRLRVGRLATVQDTPTYSTVGHYVMPGDPQNSYLIDLVSSRRAPFGWATSMPPLGTEEVDDEAVQLLTRWVEEM